MPIPPRDLDPPTLAEETRALRHLGAVVACWTALGLVPAFGLLDVIAFRDTLGPLLVLRFCGLLVVVLLLAVLRSPPGRRHPLGPGVALTVALGLMVDAMTIFTGRDASPYYAGINLILLAMSLLLPWPAAWMSFVTTVVILGYIVCVVGTGPVTHVELFGSAVAMLTATAIIAVVAARVRERLRVREFTVRATLAETVRYKDEFLAKMSHELRTPLNVMIGYADILLEEAEARQQPDTFHLLERLRQSSLNLYRMISDLLDHAKVDAGKMEIRSGPVVLDALLHDLTETFLPVAARKGLSLQVWPAPDMPPVVTDAQKVDQILTNLVGNALKFTADGGVRIAACATEPGDAALADLIVLEGPPAPLAVTTSGILVLVEDTGVGVHPADVPRLARDFAQLEGAGANFGGTGLGLSIARGLARLLGGHLAVRPHRGRGVTFALWLPVAPTTMSQAA